MQSVACTAIVSSGFLSIENGLLMLLTIKYINIDFVIFTVAIRLARKYGAQED